MNIVLTGSTGFLGSHLTRALIKEGHQIVILIRSFSDTWRIDDLLPKVTVFHIDREPIERLFKQYGPIDAVIHTATMYDRREESPLQLLKANVSFALELLETAASYGTGLFINTDSFIHKQNSGYRHLAKYALTKKQFLEWGKEISAAEHIRFLNCRLEHLYGPCDSESKFTTFIVKSCLQNIPELQLTPGNQKRDFIYVEDVVSAYCLLLKQPLSAYPKFEEFEIGTGMTTTVRKFVECVHRLARSRTKLLFGAIAHREHELMESRADNTRLRKLGWTPHINVEQGIELIIRDEQNRNRFT